MLSPGTPAFGEHVCTEYPGPVERQTSRSAGGPPHAHSEGCLGQGPQRNAALQGAREGTNEDVTVGVVRAYDEAEDVEPRILLNISSLNGEVDTDAGPSAAEARAIAANLIEAADELDRWTAR